MTAKTSKSIKGRTLKSEVDKSEKKQVLKILKATFW